MRNQRTRWVISAAITAFMVGGFAYLTTAPTPAAGGPDPLTNALRWLNSTGLTDMDFNEAESLGNVIVFIPFGIAAFVLMPRKVKWLSLFAGPLFSACIEITQGLFFPLRAASWDDFFANSTGATIGIALCVVVGLIARIFTRKNRLAQHSSNHHDGPPRRRTFSDVPVRPLG